MSEGLNKVFAEAIDKFGIYYEFIVEYGSNSGRDIDLLFLSGKFSHPSSVACIGVLDCAFYDIDSAIKLAALFEPAIIEPILGGNLLLGDKVKWKNIKDEVSSYDFSQNSLFYLEKRHAQYLISCTDIILNSENIDSDALGDYALNCFMHLLSYRLVLSYYKKTKGKPKLRAFILEYYKDISIDVGFLHQLHKLRMEEGHMSRTLGVKILENSDSQFAR